MSKEELFEMIFLFHEHADETEKRILEYGVKNLTDTEIKAMIAYLKCLNQLDNAYLELEHSVVTEDIS